MLNVLIVANVATSATTDFPKDYTGYENRNDWKTLARAEEVAAQLTASTGTLYIGTDSGPNVSPRFDVIAAPVLGVEVSRYFNGDAYPAGTITKISASLKRVETSEGVVFFRKGSSGSWINNGTWGMIQGSVSERNPSF